jgi:hypothetical protein
METDFEELGLCHATTVTLSIPVKGTLAIQRRSGLASHCNIVAADREERSGPFAVSESGVTLKNDLDLMIRQVPTNLNIPHTYSGAIVEALQVQSLAPGHSQSGQHDR